MTRMASFIVLVAIILAIGFLFFRVMATFFVPLFLAALLVVVFEPVHRRVLGWCRGHRPLAAGATTAIVVLVVVAPLVWLLTLAAIESVAVVTRFDVTTLDGRLSDARQWLDLERPELNDLRKVEALVRSVADDDGAGAEARQTKTLDNALERLAAIEQRLPEEVADGIADNFTRLRAALDELREAPPGSVRHEAAVIEAQIDLQQLKQELAGGALNAFLWDAANPSQEQLRQWRAQGFAMVREWLLSVSGATASLAGRLILDTVILVVALYFFLADGPTLLGSLMQLSPLDDQYEQELLNEFNHLSRAVVLATLLSAVAQGVLAGIGFYFAGVESVMLLTLLTIVLAIIPFVGAIAVWLPVALWLYFIEGETTTAIVLAIYGAAIVSTVDNIIKPYVLHGQSRLHPLLALLSILGGVQVIGPVGILVGPMVVVFLQSLLNILHRELLALEQGKPWPTKLAVAAAGAATSAEDESASPPAAKTSPPPPPKPPQNPAKRKRRR